MSLCPDGKVGQDGAVLDDGEFPRLDAHAARRLHGGIDQLLDQGSVDGFALIGTDGSAGINGFFKVHGFRHSCGGISDGWNASR